MAGIHPLVFGQIVHVTSDRNNRQAVRQLTQLLGNNPDELSLTAAKGISDSDARCGIAPEALYLNDDDAALALYDGYQMMPPVAASYLKDNDLGKLYNLAQFEPGAAKFFRDIQTYLQSKAEIDPVREKLFAYAEKQKAIQKSSKDSESQIINIVV